MLICKITKNDLHVGFYYKVGQVLLQSEAVFLYYKAGHMALQSRAGGKKWGRHYKVGQLLKTTAVQSTS